MKQKLLITFAVVSLISLLYCFGVYIFLDINLVPALTEPTGMMMTLANFIIFAMVI